jgi:hypothetical protein
MVLVLLVAVVPEPAASSESSTAETQTTRSTLLVPLHPVETPGTALGPEMIPLVAELSWPEIGAVSLAYAARSGAIANIGDFLDVCPTEDPMYTQIRSDFTIRRNNVVVGEVACTGPVSTMPIEEYTDELVVLQGLRTIYYMDRDMSGHLPWTSGTLYDWMKLKIGGINIKGSGAFCCEQFDSELYIVIPESSESSRDLDRFWRGISGNIGLYAHEARHVDGFDHVSCCGISGGCDENFDTANLTAYGIQWWLNNLWLTGEINVGIDCLDAGEISDIAGWHYASLNTQFRGRFCYVQPAEVSIPATPGGACKLLFEDGFESGYTGCC